MIRRAVLGRLDRGGASGEPAVRPFSRRMTMSGGVLAKAPRGANAKARRGWQWGLVATATALASLGATTTAGAAPTHTGAPTGVIVRAASGQLHDAEDAVTATG